MTWVICFVFFVSGASALIFETLWFHQSGLAFGNSVWASSLTLSGFMAGLATGNALAGRFGDSFRNPLRTYAKLELCIAITGVLLVFALPRFGPPLGHWLGPLLDQQWVLNLLRLLIAFVLLLVPSTAMGATLPILVRSLSNSDRSFGCVLGQLYGWNTLGAVFGVLSAEAFLIEMLGIRGTSLAAGALNACAALGAAALARRVRTDAEAAPVTVMRLLPRRGGRWLAAAFLSGFALLALEVVWFRLLSLYVMEEVFSFAVMLAVVLTGIALGGLIASTWLRRVPRGDRWLSALGFSAGALCILSYALSPLLFADARSKLVTDSAGIVRLCLPLMLPVSLLSGVLFTLLGAALRRHLPSEAGASGALTFVNTMGAALGALGGGFLFLPVLGMEGSILMLALLYGVIGVLVLVREGLPFRVGVGTGLAFALCAGLFPSGSMQQHLQTSVDRWNRDGMHRLVFVREGLTGTVIYLKKELFGAHLSYRLLTNGYSMAGTNIGSRRYMGLYVYWPVAVHPDPREALLISYGSGTTGSALRNTRSFEHIDVVDISKTILDASEIIYPERENDPLRDPRVQVHIEDGRYFLQTTKRRYDLITGEPPPPRTAGVVNLYTEEYFQLMRERLNEGGIVTYWLPLHSLTEVSAKAILRAFCNVFEDCSLWHGNGRDLMMVGSSGAVGPVPLDHFARQWRDPAVGHSLREIGIERPEQLGALFIGDATYLDSLTRAAAPIVDDYPRRIMAASEYSDEPREFVEWRDVRAARERFRTSPLIERLWPAELRVETLPYFRFQDSITRVALSNPASHLDTDIADLHAVLTESNLSWPVLMLLKSDPDVQRAIDELPPAWRGHPFVQSQLGVRAFAERRFADAAEAMRLTQGNPETVSSQRVEAFRLQIYALCLTGRVAEARRIARQRYASFGVSGLSPFWVWMNDSYGLDLLGTDSPAPHLARAD